jgi:DNA replication and repair protein RecF
MHLRRLKLQNFKNHSLVEFDLCAQVNCFTGLNGKGKTNVLDAIYYLGFTKSYFHAQDQFSLQHGASWFTIDAQLKNNAGFDELKIIYQTGQKKQLLMNQNEPEKFADYIGTLPLIMILPGDIFLIQETAEVRRKLIDAVISSCDRTYLNNLMAYNKYLDQRNKLLRDFANGYSSDESLLSIYNQRLHEFGHAVFNVRKQVIEAIKENFVKHYQDISGAKEQAEIVYLSDLHENEMLTCLAHQNYADRQAQRTSKGIHKDDYQFLLDGFAIKKYGSQGQQKSFVIALKLALYDYLQAQKGVKPLLLLDDIFEKLDAQRLNLLIQRISQQNFGQIFITDTHQERIAAAFASLPSIEVKYFEIA